MKWIHSCEVNDAIYGVDITSKIHLEVWRLRIFFACYIYIYQNICHLPRIIIIKEWENMLEFKWIDTMIFAVSTCHIVSFKSRLFFVFIYCIEYLLEWNVPQHIKNENYVSSKSQWHDFHIVIFSAIVKTMRSKGWKHSIISFRSDCSCISSFLSFLYCRQLKKC